MALELAEVVRFISQLDMGNVNILDYDTMQNEFDSRRFPLLVPDVYTPVTMQSITRNSFGDGVSAKQTILYTVPYVLACYSQGEGRGLQDILPGIVEAASTVATSIIRNDTPDTGTTLSVDLTIQSAQINTTVNDPKGNSYHGAKLLFLVKEFVEAD